MVLYSYYIKVHLQTVTTQQYALQRTTGIGVHDTKQCDMVARVAS